MDLMVNPVITGFRQDVDGTIKELKIGSNKQDAWANIAEQGASAKLDNNKTATIDVSTYTEPVVINPTSGKDGMKKATVTLSNIPSPSGVSGLYAWAVEIEQSYYMVYTTTTTPTTNDLLYIPQAHGDSIYTEEITEVGEGTVSNGSTTYYRYTDGDLTF